VTDSICPKERRGRRSIGRPMGKMLLEMIQEKYSSENNVLRNRKRNVKFQDIDLKIRNGEIFNARC
jgi:hypothetical protein